MTPPSPERSQFHAFVARHQRFLLTTHINPDGDGIGSEVAMAKEGWRETLEQQGEHLQRLVAKH